MTIGMDGRVKRVVLAKIDESLSSLDELSILRANLAKKMKCPRDFTAGLVIGRIYNSFHYQTRRILKRNATPEEFREFVELLTDEMERIERSVK